MMIASSFKTLLIFLSLIHGEDTCILEEQTWSERMHGCNSQAVTHSVCRDRRSLVNQTDYQQCGGNFSRIPVYLDCYNGIIKVDLSNYSSCVSARWLTSYPASNEEETLATRSKRNIQSWQWYVYLYIQPIVIVSGLLGNTLSIILMASKEMRKLTFSCFLTGLAVSDSLALVHFTMDWMDSFLPDPWFSGRITCHAACLFYPLIVRGCYLSSAWLMVAFTLDRAFSICCPFNSKMCISKRQSLLITGLIPVACLLSQIYHPILYPEGAQYCGQVFGLPKTHNFNVNEIMVILSRSLLLLNLPFLFILISNMAVVVAVKRRWKVVPMNNLNNKKDKIRPPFGKETAMSLKLLTVSLTFFVFLLPDYVVLMLDVARIAHKTEEWFLHGNSYRSICKLIFTCNFAINFFLYVFAFRKKLPWSCCREKLSPNIPLESTKDTSLNENNVDLREISQEKIV